jgi:outer membrane lipoprotein-sorting protein
MKAYKAFLIGVLAAILLFLVTGSSSSDREVARALQQQNQELKRIASSLEIISGQRGNWKLPQN